MNICRIAFMTASILLSSMAIADVTPPWIAAEFNYHQEFFPVVDADWVTETGSGSFDILPGTYGCPFTGPDFRYVVQEIGPVAELQVRVANSPGMPQDGGPYLTLFAGERPIASMLLVDLVGVGGVEYWIASDEVGQVYGTHHTLDNPMRWLRIAIRSPWIGIMGSSDGQNWQTLAASTSSAEGPYHIAFGVSDSCGEVVPISFDNVELSFSPVAVESKSWGQVKLLYY